MAQANSLSFVIELSFLKNGNDQWEITDSEINDIKFNDESKSEYERCLAAKYKPIKEK